MGCKILAGFLILLVLVEAGLAATSEENRRIAEKNYPNEPVQRFVATHAGDELPAMRDRLIELKNQGMGPVDRHVKAYGERDNWKPDMKAVKSFKY